jgi:hypothetical protein
MQEGWDERRARAWRRFLPPARPSPGELSVYEDALFREESEAPLHCILLGSTPELRSLVHRHAYRLTVIDWNEAVFRALSPMVDPPGEERFHPANWLELEPLEVDVALGDGSINMLPVKDHPALLQRVRDVLRPGGLAALRVHVLRPPVFASPAAVFEWYRSSGQREPIFTATRTHLDALWFDAPSQSLDLRGVHERLRALHRSGELRDEELEGYEMLANYDGITLHYSRHEEFLEQARRWFDVEGVRSGGDYTGHASHAVYLLRKPTNSGWGRTGSLGERP